MILSLIETDVIKKILFENNESGFWSLTLIVNDNDYIIDKIATNSMKLIMSDLSKFLDGTKKNFNIAA